MLALEEECMLANRWRDPDAAQRLVTSHLRLVAKIIMGYRGYGLPLSDLILEGDVGMTRVVNRFDPDRSFRLATDAVWWIRDEWSEKSRGRILNEMKVVALPWPREALQTIRTATAQTRVALSYFAGPNPSEMQRNRKLRYAMHGLRFRVKGEPAFCFRLAAVLVLAAALTAPARAADPLTSEQKAGVEEVIRDYFLKHPEFMVEVLRAAEAKLRQEKVDDARQVIAANRDALVADATSPVGGNPEGDVTIVEFFDYRCPYCKQVEPALEALVREDPKIRIVYKEFPVLGADSVYASRMALAALKQGKYDIFHRALMATKGQITQDVILKVAATAGIDIATAKAEMTAPDIQEIIKRNYALAEALDIKGTPVFIIGDVVIPGTADISGLRKLVANARKQG